MKLKELGERSFLKDISHLVRKMSGARLGFDDDASDIPLSDDKNLVINVDTFVAKTDWLPGMTEAQVGRKVAVMALSDIVVKGAKPVATLLSLCVPDDYDVSKAKELVRGYSQYCLKNSLLLVGGDLGTSDDIILTGIALGIAPPLGIVPRTGAKPGDIVAVTGRFGLTSVAYEILLNKLEAKETLRKRALTAAFKPELDFQFVRKLAEIGAITSSMDSSDGLAITLHTLAQQSGCGLIIDDIPDAVGVLEFSRQHNLDTNKMIFGGGEEFIHVLTIPSDCWEDSLNLARLSNIPLQPIGKVVANEGIILETAKASIKLPVYGYDTFLEWT
ncbi:MAG: thiamine-phosphate kinase [Candidatus Lokiarchaeota archaeon]|nr:thiamine-phosphate kinase [Candidatus Lokiarchaeota archaeon]